MNFVVTRCKLFVLSFFLLMGLIGPGWAAAEEAAPVFELPEYRGAADRPEPGVFGLDSALGAVGLPGTGGASSNDSAYEEAWRMSDSPTGGTRLTYGQRYRRNPDGSYGARSSSEWSGVSNISERLLEQALSAGSGYFSSWAEGWLGGFGKARISVRVNDEGDVTGAGDFLYPIYDSERNTFFTQIGLRSMSGDRVIGNFGLGQRFFPAENLALGYNAFIDQDFSRNHSRGGAGVEAWYDWLRLSANYYTPLSGWKDSEDYDSHFVEERPAEGYDARLTGYLPFYRNLAVTGAFEKWKGDHVGAFGRDDFLNKNPKVWSYGLEWTPVPAFSASVNQRHSGGRDETQFGLTFNYNFGMAWQDQIAPAAVAEMRTVGGSRHDFVDRQNEMILEYRAKDVYNIEYMEYLSGSNVFVFRLTDGLGHYAAGLTVRVSAGNNVSVAALEVKEKNFLARAGETLREIFSARKAFAASPSGVFITDREGLIRITLSPPPGDYETSLTLTAGKTSRTFEPLAVSGQITGGPGLTGLTLSAPSFNRTNFVSGNDFSSTAMVTAKAQANGLTQTINPGDIVWEVKSSSITAPWWKRAEGAYNGLLWGGAAASYGGLSIPPEETSLNGLAPTGNQARLTDIIGNRTVVLKATWIGDPSNPKEVTITFGNGPLSVFRGGPLPTLYTWASVSDITSADSTTTFPSAGACGGSVAYSTWGSAMPNSDWEAGAYGTGSYSKTSLLAKTTNLQAVSGPGSYTGSRGAALGAGWDSADYVTGDIYDETRVRLVSLSNGNTANFGTFDQTRPVVCLNQ